VVACQQPGTREPRSGANEAPPESTPLPPGDSHRRAEPSPGVAKRQELCSEERVQIDLMEQSEQGTKLRVDGALAWEVWRGSLSHDAAEDRIVRFVDDCGNWGECAHAAYLACREGHFVLVYGPDYFVSLEPLDVPDESGFARLRGAARNEDAEEPGVDTVILRFRDGAYEPQR